MTVSDDGGLNISWLGGQLRTPDGRTITIAAGSDTCTDDAINHLKWVAGTALTLSATPGIHGTEVCIGHVACQDGDIWEVHTEPTLSNLLPDIQDGLENVFPLVVSSGCLVSEDTDATDPFDVTVSAGAYYHDLHDVHVIAAFDTRAANTLIRCFIDGSGPETWDFTADGAQSEIDIANWNSGTSLIGTSVGKYYLGLMLISEDNVFWIYAQEQHNTVAAAIDGALPTIPPGLALFPRSVAYVYKHGDAAFEPASSDRWIDVRPLVTGSVAAGPITDHGNLVGLPDDDHAQYWLLAGRERAGTLKANTDFATLINTSNAADMDGTRTSILWRQARLTDTILDAGRIGFEAADDWGAGAGTQDADFVVECREQGAMTEKLRIQTASGGGVASFFSNLQAIRENDTTTFAAFCHSGTATHNATFSLRKSRGTNASPTAVVNGDRIALLDFRGYDGSSYQQRAAIRVDTDGVVNDGLNRVPMKIIFRTGIGSIADRLIIDSSGDILLATSGVRLGFNNASTHYIEHNAGALIYEAAAPTGHRFQVATSKVAELDTDELRLYTGASLKGSIAWTASVVSIFQGVSEAIRLSAGFQSIGGRLGVGTHFTPAASAVLELSSTMGALIVSRMTTTQRNALTAVDGMILYNSTTGQFNFREGGAWVTGSGLA